MSIKEKEELLNNINMKEEQLLNNNINNINNKIIKKEELLNNVTFEEEEEEEEQAVNNASNSEEALLNNSMIRVNSNKFDLIRYIKLVNTRDDFLHLCGIKVFDKNDIDISLGKSTSQSSIGWNGQSDNPVKSIDKFGNYYKGTCNHTQKGIGESWQVDLGKPSKVKKVQLFNRTDCCTKRIHDVDIQFLDSEGKIIYRDNWGSPPDVLNINKIINLPKRFWNF